MMRRFLFFCFLLFVLVIPVYSAVYILPSDSDVWQIPIPDQPVVDLPVDQAPMPDQPAVDLPGIPGNDFVELPSIFDIPAVDIETYTLEPITPSNTTGLKRVLLSVLGNYESIVTDYRYQNASGNWQYLREVQPDYVWCCSAGVFALLLWCVFRMAGGLFCRR